MRRANKGETRAERAFINISNLTRLRDVYDILGHIMHSADPLNIPDEEYQRVMQTIDGWIANLENRPRGR